MNETNQIIITTNNEKINLLKNNNKLNNNKIYTLSEFTKLYYFDYNEETIYYIMNKYNTIYEIAKIYLNNMYYLKNLDYKNQKLSFLTKLKQDLLNNNYLKTNELFLNYLQNKDIIFYHLPITKELNILIDSLSKIAKVKVIDKQRNNYTHPIYELETIEDEVLFIANKITDLIRKDISINNIYLTNLNDEYRKIIKKIFPMFNIPFTLNDADSIYTTSIATKFFENYESDLSITLEKIAPLATTKESKDIYNQIINIINKYYFINDKNLIKDMIKQEFKNTKLKKEDNKLSVHEKDLKDSEFTNNDYVFITSFNQGTIPIIYKDEDYLNDEEKNILNISLTVDKNNQEKNNITNIIKSIKNAFLTYKKTNEGEECNISNINELLNYEVIIINDYNLNNSDIYNKLKLTSLLDEHYKYNTTSNLLNDLYHHYPTLPYLSYDNKFTGINNDSYHEYINNKLTLSYSSLDKFYRCPFSYYIGNVLKLNKYEETFFQLIGTIFHKILETYSNSDKNYDELWNKTISDINHEFNAKEQFFLKKLKEELKFIIDTINHQENFTNLHDELHEEQIYTNIEGNINITFTGIIDKIKYKETNEETIVAIIDYKTGNPNLDLTTINYGINMQLPIYLYLAHNSSKLKNIKVAGFYLQKILNNEIIQDNTNTYEDIKKKKLLLQGYSNIDMKIISEFDTSYQDSNIIKSLRVKSDGDFYNYSKVLSSKEMNKLKDIAEDKIKMGAKDICESKFTISPKKIGGLDQSCNLCKFKDICFHTNNDYEELPEQKLEEILEGGN